MKVEIEKVLGLSWAIGRGAFLVFPVEDFLEAFLEFNFFMFLKFP